MRIISIRKKTWEYYGINKKDRFEIIDSLKCHPDVLDDIIKQCQVPDGITNNVKEWVLNGTSYNKQYHRSFIPMGDADFYGWCRKVIAIYYNDYWCKGDFRDGL